MRLFIVYAILIGILIGYIRGGRIRWITTRNIRYSWLVFCSLSIQIVIFSNFPFVKLLSQNIITLLHIVSYTLSIAFIIINAKIPGITIVGSGALLNFLVISLNGGYMPSFSLNNAKFVGGDVIDRNIVQVSKDTYLPWLGDIFKLPDWLPFTNNFSIGDIIVAIGVCIYFSINMRPANK